MDLPAIALELIDRFINAHTFADSPLPSEQFSPSDDPPPEAGDTVELGYGTSSTALLAAQYGVAGAIVVMMLLLAGTVVTACRLWGAASR